MTLTKEEKREINQRIKAYQKKQKDKRKMLKLSPDYLYSKTIIKFLICFLIAFCISLIIWLIWR